jgi:hypothetical protein
VIEATLLKRVLGACVGLLLLAPAFAQVDGLPIELYEHALVHHSEPTFQTEYEIGLGALQKVGGRWRFKASERVVGELSRTTWQVDEAYTAKEAFNWYRGEIEAMAEPLFLCSGRDCGRSAQWADRVFQQRVLYGHDDRQLYGAWRGQVDGQLVTWVLYGVDRGSRRHYIHLDVLMHSQ